MTAETNPMVVFFDRLGHKIIQSQSSWWYEVQPGVLFVIPYYKLITPDENELSELMQKYKCRAIRYPTTLDSYGFLSNITINTNKKYDLKDLHQKARNQTRRGLENCKVEQVDFNYLIEKALPINDSTARRQRRESQYAEPDYWKKFCLAADSVEGITAWGSFVEGRLASFLVSAQVQDGWREWIVNHSSTGLLSKYPNNALAFTVAQYFFQKEDCNGICYGLGSLEETSRLDHFKSRMGWTVMPIKQRLVFSSKLDFAAKMSKEPLLKLLNTFFPKSYTVRKASAMMRLYRKQTLDVIVE